VDRTRVVIDTDPGVDDAVAILMALASEKLDVVAITAVAGNSPLVDTARNARRLVDLAGRADVLVAAGCDVPLGETDYVGGDVHGADGLGDLTWEGEPRHPLDPRHGVEVLRDVVLEAPTTIIAIGPLTNLAVLAQRYPEVVAHVERLVIMGGASFQGNVTPAAEFNIWFDPEAAAEVFAQSWPITVMPLDLTHQAFLNDDDLAALRGLGTEVGRRVADMLEPYAVFHQTWYGNRDIIMHDAMAVYELLEPNAIAKQGAVVHVEVEGRHGRGATFIDRGIAHQEAETKVGVSVDNDVFRAYALALLAKYS
jgi:inosine-uridine nucleoside N-ribohydrolase